MNWIKSIVKFWKTIQIILLYVISILLVYFMFPREGKFKYEYSKGKPWMHETLVAPFDFPIYKPEQQVQREKDSLQRNTKLYFFHDSLIGNNSISSFGSDYNGMVSSMGIGAYVSDAWTYTGYFISDILSEIYATGLIERHPILDGMELDQLSIMAMRNGLAEESRIIKFYTERSAYEHLIAEIERINPGSLAILSRLNLSD